MLPFEIVERAGKVMQLIWIRHVLAREDTLGFLPGICVRRPIDQSLRTVCIRRFVSP